MEQFIGLHLKGETTMKQALHALLGVLAISLIFPYAVWVAAPMTQGLAFNVTEDLPLIVGLSLPMLICVALGNAFITRAVYGKGL
jgi:hypothetical protein